MQHPEADVALYGDSADYAAFVIAAFGAAEYEVDLTTYTLRASARLNLLYGYPAEHQLTLANSWARFHPDDYAALAAIVPTAQATGETRFQTEFRIRLPDGTLRWLLACGEVCCEPAGRPVFVRGAVLDISERKHVEAALYRSDTQTRVEEQLRASEARLKLALTIADVALAEVDYTTDTIRLSPEAAALYGFAAAEASVPRVEVHATFHPEDRPVVAALIAQAMQPGSEGVFVCEHRVVWPDGQVRWLSVRKQIFFTGAAHTPGHAVLVAQDITDRKRRELNVLFLSALQQELSQAASVEAILQLVGAQLSSYLGLTHCVFAELAHEQNEVFLLHDQRTPDAVPPMSYTELGRFLTDTEVQQLTAGSSLIINDVLDGDRPIAARAAFAHVGVRALLSVPYCDESKRWFVLSVQRAQPYVWQTDEHELVESVVARLYPRLEQVRAEAALRTSEERLRSVFESIDEGFCIAELFFDADNRPIDYRFVQVNPLFEQLTGLDGALGRTARELVPDLEDWWFEIYGRVALTGEAVRFEHGSVAMGRVFNVYASRIGGPESRQVAIVFTNITARKMAEEQARAAFAAEQAARRAAEQAFERTTRLQALTAALAGALTRHAVIQVITDHGVAATGATMAVVGLLDAVGEQFEVVGWVGQHAELFAAQHSIPLEAFTPPAQAVQTAQPIWLGSREAAEARFPGFGVRMERFGDHAQATLPLLAAERVLGVLVFGYPQPCAFPPEEQAFLTILAQQCAQALERAQLYSEVLVGQERLQHLSQRLLQAQEHERRHLARELHDEVGQSLTGLRMVLELADRLPPEERAAQLAEAHRITQDLIAQIRAISLDLRPAMLDDMGLLPALIWQIKRYREQTGITVELRHWGLEQRLPLAIETVAYRVIQEALTNIARHAGVDTAHVTVLASHAQVLVQVRDAGCGFVLGDALAHGNSSGLAGMQERVALLGGTLSIETGPGLGTAITVDLPLNKEAGS